MKIRIELKNREILEYTTVEPIVTVEMPYGCIGYRFDGSSEADEQDLNYYWNIVDQILAENNKSSDQYLTLIDIT